MGVGVLKGICKIPLIVILKKSKPTECDSPLSPASQVWTQASTFLMPLCPVTGNSKDIFYVMIHSRHFVTIMCGIYGEEQLGPQKETH